MSNNGQVQIKFRQLLVFFIPLGFSSTLISISHVIINSTLARSAHPEIVIACYALPLSILNVFERPALLLRQTSSVLVRDRRSFRAMAVLTLCVLGTTFLLDIVIAYTPLGPALFAGLFGAEAALTDPMVQVYRILMFVTLFSGIRCVYQGLLISNMRTKWLTIGMLTRLGAMYLVALYFIQTERVTSAAGAVIFLTGMVIETSVSFLAGRRLLKKAVPDKRPDHPVERPRQIFKFYKPLLYSSFIAVVTEPSINAVLAKTPGFQLSVASFAVAFSLTELVQSFFSYIHQIVLHFYHRDAAAVRRFVMGLSLIPGLFMAVLAYSPAGPWFLQHVMGLNEPLMVETLSNLRVFMITALIFPWLDYNNGMLLLRGQTKVFVWSQITNVCTVLTVLVLCVAFSPGWNGKIGALAQSLGVAAEMTVVLLVLRKMSKGELFERLQKD